MLMSDTLAELQNRDYVSRQLKDFFIEEDERPHAEQLSMILHQGQAEQCASDINCYRKGEQPRAIIESTRAQAHTPLIGMAS